MIHVNFVYTFFSFCTIACENKIKNVKKCLETMLHVHKCTQK